MAYKLMYNDGILFEPFSDDVVYDAKLTARYNNPDYLDFTIPYGHSLYSTVAERAGVVKLYFDNILLFDGEITSIEIDMEGNKSISCDGALAYLQDSLVRPYSTIKGEEQYTAPSTVNGLFQWYVDQHNEHVMDPRKQFTVEVNQGASLDTNNYIYRSNNGLPTTWSEINDKLIDSLGGYLFVDYEDTVHILNYYADVHENNTQIIDFGVNILDFSKTIDTTDQYTAVRPSGATPEAPEGSTEEQKPITIESLADGGTKYSDIVKKGDVVYSVDGVVRYGYREYHYSNTDITTQSGLLESACRVLNNLLSPTTTITVKAVDLSLYMEGYTHLKVGEAVRIRSKLHDEDEYLMVNSITLDLQNPGNSEYEIGQAYDTLTGQQSAYLKSLNSGINKSLDSVAALDTKAKETAEVAKTAAEQAEEAKQKAEEAETNSSAAQKAAEAAQTAAEKTVTEAKNAADKATDAAMAADEAKSKVTVIESNVTTKINEFNTKVDASTTASANAEKNASAALDKANDAYTSVGKIQSQVEHIDSAVKDVDTKATNIRDELAGQIETVTNTMTADYTKKSELSETTETLKKEITESAAGVKSEVALTYATKTDLATTTEATEAAKKAAQAAQDTANKNATDLANTIVKYDGKVEDLQSQIDGAIETWFYDGVPTTSNAPAKDWVDDKVKKNHLGDLYYDNKTGYSYRWQVQNGTYSWSRITDVDVTKALANAAKAQDTADNKRRVFVTTPKPPYDQGDLWVQGSGGDIMRCQTAKTSTQSYAAADWVLASKYTDDTGVDTLSNHVSTYYAAKSTVEQLADKWSVTNNSITQIQLDPEAAETEVANAKKAATEAKNNVTTAKSNLATAKTNLDTANANLEKAKADPSITYDQLDKFKTAAREAQVKYNAAVDAVTMAEAAVTVANNLVTAATDRLTAVQSLDNRITSNKTAIETNDKEIKLTASSLSTKIDGIAIGGCNLIQNSTGNLNKTTYWNTESGSCEVASVTTMDDYSGNCIKFVQSAAGGRFYFSANMFAHTNGQEYTLTFWAKSSSTVTFGAYEGGTTAITTASIDSSKWTKFQKTYTASTTYSLTLKASAATTVYIAKLKLESGNKATDWTPAPEDLLVNAETYSDAQLKITADKITSDVSKTYATQTALATTNANVTTAQSTANTAKSNADTAQNTANAVKTDLANNYTKSVISAVNGNGNSAAYLSIATIKVLKTYANRSISITCSNRSNKQTTYNLVFANASNTDPGIATFTRNGSIEAWIAKSTTSTWILYVKKSESYDINYVVGYSNPDKSFVSVTFGGTNVASLPTSNIIAATAEIGSNSASNYYTITQVDTKISQSETNITGTVSKTYATIKALDDTNANVTTAQSTANTAKSAAATAQNTANSKRRVFTATPTPPYDVGDLWVQGSTGDIKRCGTAKASGKTYAASDWVLASKYTDDTTANTAIANVKTLDSKVDQQIDKVTTYIRESSGNIMNGTADFSALTGGAWANSAIRVTGTATLAHGHNSTCPVPNSDQVVITATTANTLGGFCQDGYTDIIATDKLTISCYVKASVKGSKVKIQPFWNSTGVPSDYAKTITLSDTNWTYVTHTATASVTTTNSIGCVYLQSSTANAKLYVCGIKVERGTFASAWCASSTDLTNYMRFSSSGLEIAKKVNGSVGSTKAVITDSAFQIQNSSGTTLSSFGATDVELAMTSDTAYIYFCKKLGYIAGHNSSLLFYSKYMRVGTSSTSVHVGESADLVVVGNMADRASFGYLSPDVEVGGQSKSVKLGSLATTVDLGLSATTVKLGSLATTVDLGTNSTNVNVGSGATNVTVGSDSGTTTLNLKNRTINVGSSLNANGSNVHIYGPLYYRRSTSHTDHVILKATSLWSGTLSKGGSVTITQLQSWTLFGVLVTGYSVLLPMLSTGAGSLSASASYDDGSTSVSLKASFSISGTTLKLISASKHVFDTTVAGTSLNVYRIYGIF